MMKWPVLCILLLISFWTSAQDFNRPVPQGFPQYQFEILDSSFTGFYTNTVKISASNNDLQWLSVLDNQGYLLWCSGTTFHLTDFHFHSEHSLFSYTRASGFNGLQHLTLDTMMQVVDTVAAPATMFGDVHEYLILSNGNRVIIATHTTVMDLSSNVFDGQAGSASTIIASNDILEFDPAGNIVFQWDGVDHVDPSEYVDGIGNYNPQHFDYMHANAIDIDFDGHYLISLRHTSSVLKINRNDGSVIWRLGGNASDFSFPNDAGFSGNHAVRSLGDNRYSLFDNGNLSGNPKESRAVKYELDTLNMIATRVWEYRHDPLVYASAMGNYHELEDGGGFVNWGRVMRPEPTFTMIDSLNDPMVNMYFEDTWISYRTYAEPGSFNLARPEITCVEQNGQITLTSSPAAYYAWSTGEATQSITVSATGTYMVWTKCGIGMAGSLPFHLTDLQHPCSLVGIEESVQEDDELLWIYDLMGREVIQPCAGHIYMLRFASGQVRKVMWSSQMRLEDW
jgi:hypothetical protein